MARRLLVHAAMRPHTATLALAGAIALVSTPRTADAGMGAAIAKPFRAATAFVHKIQPSRWLMAKAGEMDARKRPGPAHTFTTAAHVSHVVEQAVLAAPMVYLSTHIFGGWHPAMTFGIGGGTLVLNEVLNRGRLLKEDFYRGQIHAEAKRRLLDVEAAQHGASFTDYVGKLRKPSQHAARAIREAARAQHLSFDEMTLKMVGSEPVRPQRGKRS
jgi:hypothetical protein